MTNPLTLSCSIEDVINGHADRNQILVIGNVPEVYLSLGVPNFKIVMMQATLIKVIKKHRVAINTVKNLSVLLKRPAMIFRSATQEDALVVVIDATDYNGDAVIVIINPNRKHKQHRLNIIASVYGKSRSHWFMEQIKQGRMIYSDKEKALSLSRSAQLQLSGEVIATGRSEIIPINASKVKKNNHTKHTLTLTNKGSNDENK